MAEKETKSTEVAEVSKPFSEIMTESLSEKITSLPVGFNTERFVNNAVALLNENKQLGDFAREHGTAQIKSGLMKAAFLNLDAMNKEFYLIPYGDKLDFSIDYRGNVKLCKKYSIRPIKDIYAKLVREDDEFEEKIINGEQSIDFKPKPFNNGKIVGAFAVCLFQDGGMIYDTMSIEDLENTRSASKAYNSPAWKKFTGEMYKKTVLHRLCKHIEIDFESTEQYKYFNEELEIETDAKEIAKNSIEESAGTEDFIDTDGFVVE